MKTHSGKHRRYCFKIALLQEKKIKNVQELLIIVYRKKERNLSESLAKATRKSTIIKNTKNLKFMFLRLTLIREHYFLAG